MSKQNRKRISFHEAAHAVARRMQGGEVIAVMMFHTDENTPASTFGDCAAFHAKQDAASLIAALESDIRVSLAGPVGDELYSKGRSLSRKMRDGATDDDEQSLNCAVRVAMLIADEPIPEILPGERVTVDINEATFENAHTILRRLRKETKILLTEHWPAIERVAEVLMTSDIMYRDELDRLIAG
jgi:hypothetical protein